MGSAHSMQIAINESLPTVQLPTFLAINTTLVVALGASYWSSGHAGWGPFGWLEAECFLLEQYAKLFDDAAGLYVEG